MRRRGRASVSAELAPDATSRAADPGQGRGESNTPFPGKICRHDPPPVYVIAGVGIDQLRVVLSLSGESAQLCRAFTEHDFKPRGMPNMRMVGAWHQGGFKRTFLHFMGEDGPRLLYHRDSATLHVDIHFSALASVAAATENAESVVARLRTMGVESLFPVRIARADVTGDVIFASSDYFRYVFSAFRAMVCERGRAVEPFKRSTLYLNASSSNRTKRLGRVYDKGAERAATAGWNVSAERYLRIEAERVWETPRPPLEDLSSELARGIFRDRFCAVGRGTLVLKAGLVRPLAKLLAERRISVSQYERLYTFLDHSRMGLAREVYAAETFQRRAREARQLALDIPGLDDEPLDGLPGDLDVRALVEDVLARL
jgi:hypothetical protein